MEYEERMVYHECDENFSEFKKRDKTMTTFNELKERTTPDNIKEMCKLAEGEMFDSDFINWLELHFIELFDLKILFPLLLYRAVEGWNKEGEPILIANNKIVHPSKVYPFSNYRPCRLTQREMAIWDCLLESLKQEGSDE